MDVSDALETFSDGNMYICLNDGVWDFTLKDDLQLKTHKRPSLCLMNSTVSIDYPLPTDGRELRSCLAKLWHYLNNDRMLLSWDIKDLFTYYLGQSNCRLTIGRPIIDLKPLESFAGVTESKPKSYAEAERRLGRVVRSSRWESLKQIYAEVYLPLTQEVLPAIETTGLERGKKKFYPHYEIEGQVNGRLKASKFYSQGFNPHGIPKDELHNYGLGEHDDLLCLYFDYHALEVRVLQWLSRDPVLSEILKTGEDVYKIIWERITKVECTPDFREKCKSIFLPVVYGMGTATLAERLQLQEPAAKWIIGNINKEFSVAMSWVKEQQESNSYDGCVYDYFGRRRRFQPNEHKIRNYVTQAPASIICLHKLVKLYYALKGRAKIVYHVHDGYMVSIKKNQCNNLIDVCRKILEAKHDLYPGLELKVTTQIGERLHKLQTIN